MSKTNWYPCRARGGIRRVLLLGALLLVALHVTASGASAARKKPAVYRWAHIPVVHVPPSQLFKALGLTHITRMGSTTKSWEDPGFPKDLTDVVPYDSQHVMLVRGTDSGLAAYQPVIAAADFAAQHWQLTVELVRVDSGREQSVATQIQKDVVVGAPLTVALGPDTDSRAYRFKVASGTESALQVSCQPCFALPAAPPPPPAPVPSAPAGAAAVPAKPVEAPPATIAPTVPAAAVPATSAIAGQPQTTVATATGTASATAAASPAKPVAAPTPAPPIKVVLTPAMVSTVPMSKTVRPGEAVTFTDSAASRLAVLRKLGSTGTTETVDYLIRITCIAVPADAVAAANPAGASAPARP